MKTRDILIVIVSILVFLSIFLFIDPQTYINNLRNFNPIYLLIIIALFFVDLNLRVLRWWVLFKSQEHQVPITGLVYPSYAGSFVNLLLPGRAGDLIRLYALRDKYDVKYSVGLSVIVVEQVINVMGLIIVASSALALILVTGISFDSNTLNTLIPLGFIGTLLMIVALAILFVVDPNRFIPLFFFLPEKIHSKVVRLIHTFSFGLQTIKKKFYIFWVALGCSASIWFMEGIIIWLITLNLYPNFEFPIALFASAIGNINFFFPILPGAIGQYEAVLAIILALSPVYNPAIGGAVSVALSDRIVKSLILAVLGSFSLAKLGSDTITLIQNKTDSAEKIEKAKEEFAD